MTFSRKAQADVYTASDISYYEPTNSIWIWAEARPNYGTLANYCIGHVSDVFKNDVQVDMFNAQSCDSVAYGEVFLPYDPSAEYTVVVNPGVDLRWQSAEGAGYNDVYGFIVWSNQEPVYSPNYFNFFGAGPPMETWSNSISLGTVFSFFAQGGSAGPPHHLKVITDRTITRTDGNCSRANKLVDFQIVDYHNRPAGRITVDEEPKSYSLIDTCSNQQVFLNPCSDIGVSFNGSMTDSLRTGCPNANKPPDCGFDFGNRWRWCRRGGPYYYDSVNLAWMYYDVRRPYVKVDGEEDMTDGTYKYP